MQSLVVCIATGLLTNPDLDICYELPEILNRESRGAIRNDGYEFTDDQQGLVLYFAAERLYDAVAVITGVIEEIEVLENDLRKAAIVAVEQDQNYKVVYPRDFDGQFSL